MVADIKIDVNTIEVKKLLKKISSRQRKAIQRSLNRISNMAILMITKRTQRGFKPDGGRFIQYSKAYKESEDYKKKKNKFLL